RLEPQDMKTEQFTQASALHFGSISLIQSPAREATKKAVELAKANNVMKEKLAAAQESNLAGLSSGPHLVATAVCKSMRLVGTRKTKTTCQHLWHQQVARQFSLVQGTGEGSRMTRKMQRNCI
ncbi:MAG TPA: hypothetical protein V6C97_09260, partial [Oculatellaceae cyanobacterium]